MVNIIVPVFNAEKFLSECIESVLQQDYEDIRLFLIDDGSTDNSALICKSFSDSRIKYIKKENGGVSSARNVGLKNISEGEYIMFLDSDDRLPHDAIRRLVDSIEITGSDIVIGAHQLLYGESLKPHNSRLAPGEYDIQSLLSSFIDDGTLSGFLLGSVWGTLYKTEIIKSNNIEFDADIKINEDGLFNFEYALKSHKLNVISDVVYHYRQYSFSSTSNRRQEYDFNAMILERLNLLNWDKEMNCLEEQMQARNVSVALWDLLLYPGSMRLKDGVGYITKRISKLEVREGLKYIKFDKLSSYKKIFAYLIKYKQSLLLYLIIKIIPILDSKLQR